jgi:hypothetical protein
VSDGRAVLAANMETVVNALWDAAPRLGERVAVVGAGVIGALAAALAARIPGAAVQLVDVNPEKAEIAGALGVSFAVPKVATPRADLVIHASGTAEGLATSLDLAGFEAKVVELSWYGDRAVAVPLGESFHSRRLRLLSSQVGAIATAQRARWDRRRRLALALDLLADARFDVLLAPAVPFARLPQVMTELAERPSEIMCQGLAAIRGTKIAHDARLSSSYGHGISVQVGGLRRLARRRVAPKLGTRPETPANRGESGPMAPAASLQGSLKCLPNAQPRSSPLASAPRT